MNNYATIKRGTTPTIPIQVELDDMSLIATIDFLFKQKMMESDTKQVLKSFPSEDVRYEAETNTFYVSFSEEDTRVFEPSTTMYLDVRPITTTGHIIPTEVVPLNVYLTLYAPTDGEG